MTTPTTHHSDDALHQSPYADDSWTNQPYGPPAEPPQQQQQPVPQGRRRRTGAAALLLAACLASGATGAGVTRLIAPDDAAAPGAVASSSTSRSSTVPTAATSGGTAQTAATTISPSVVTIAVTGTESSAGGFGQPSTQQVSDTGSGIVLRSDGYIVTNNHVVAAAANGGSVSVTFSDGTTESAKIVGTDPTSDLAVVKVSRTDLTAAVFADSDKLSVGQAVLAVGAPLGLSNTVTEGIVSTLHRPVRTGESGASAQSVIDAVQTDAAINPGNSGGALVDLSGQVVGVNSAIASTGQSSSGTQSGNIGVGFAIPSNDVVEVADELIADGTATHAQIGISVGDAASANDGTPGLGATVQQVTSGSPAAAAGLKSGDVITKVDDRAVTDSDSLIVAVRAHQPGDSVTITYTRGGSTQTTKATLVANSGS